ncbi:MAG: hypothetical protein Q8P67_16305, partial [archaeon]|nr:hypothetical protein [archaeon]
SAMNPHIPVAHADQLVREALELCRKSILNNSSDWEALLLAAECHIKLRLFHPIFSTSPKSKAVFIERSALLTITPKSTFGSPGSCQRWVIIP